MIQTDGHGALEGLPGGRQIARGQVQLPQPGPGSHLAGDELERPLKQGPRRLRRPPEPQCRLGRVDQGVGLELALVGALEGVAALQEQQAGEQQPRQECRGSELRQAPLARQRRQARGAGSHEGHQRRQPGQSETRISEIQQRRQQAADQPAEQRAAALRRGAQGREQQQDAEGQRQEPQPGHEAPRGVGRIHDAPLGAAELGGQLPAPQFGPAPGIRAQVGPALCEEPARGAPLVDPLEAQARRRQAQALAALLRDRAPFGPRGHEGAARAGLVA
jgi:hypothetical protein